MSEGTIVNVPGVGAVNFPAGMSDADIEDAIKTKILPQAKGTNAVTGPNTTANAFGNAVAQGGTLGLADELGATVRAAAPEFSNWMMRGPSLQRAPEIGGGNEPPPQTVSTAPTFGSRYDEELARIRAQSKADTEAHPYATGAGQLVGNLAATAPLMAVLPSVAGTKMLGNALKYSDPDTPVTFEVSGLGDYLHLRISDQGIGIPEADLPHLFGSFHRGTNVGNIAGTGIGLHIVKECVDLHQGTIEVSSQPGKGATFNVRLFAPLV